jgi:hypothetical protein
MKAEDKALFVQRLNEALIECGAGRYDELKADPMAYERRPDGTEVVVRRAHGMVAGVSIDSLPALMADVHRQGLV